MGNVKPMKINFVVGLPGSGKSKLLKDKEFKIDDLVNPQFPECDELWITDPRFCDDRFFNDCLLNLRKIYGQFQHSTVYFDNNVQKCLQNIEHRRLHGDEREVEGLLKRLSRKYQPINPIEVESEFVL